MQFIRRWLAGRRRHPPDFPCPHCGAEVPGGRQACPQCGASNSDSWSGEEGEIEEGDDDFDYDSFVQREFGEPAGWEHAKTADPKRLILWLVIAAFAAATIVPMLF